MSRAGDGGPVGDDNGWDEPAGGDDGWDEPEDLAARWPLTWRGLYPRELWLWFEHLWSDVCALRERYRIAVRSRWWEDEIQVETLAALSAWVARYDSGEWDDPPGKLGLIFDLERISAVLRDGFDPFDPVRDRAPFERHVRGLGGLAPPSE